MPMHAKPCVFIGLGAAGAEAAQNTVDEVGTTHPHLRGTSCLITLTAEAGLVTRAAGQGDVPASGIQELDGEWRVGVWGDNYQRLVDAEAALETVLGRGVQTVLQLGSHDRAGVLNVDVYVFATLSDPVGSAAVIPVLHALKHAFQYGAVLGVPHHVHLLLLAPDLLDLPDEISPLAQARAFAALREIDHALSLPVHEDPRAISADFVWLFGARNEAGLFAESFRDLLPVFAQFIAARASGEMVDQSFGVVLTQIRDGKRTRYGSFGYTRLVYPRDLLVGAAEAVVTYRSLQHMPALSDVRSDAQVVYAETSEFIRNQRLDRLTDSMKIDGAGSEIYRPFVLPLHGEPDATFLPTLDAATHAYARTVDEMQHAVGLRRKGLENMHREAVLGYVHTLIDDRTTQGGASRARAWLSALAGEAYEAIDGDPATLPVTLRTLDADVRVFFDREFAPLLLDDKGDEDLAAYLRDHGVRVPSLRALPERLIADLGAKRQLLELYRASLVKVRAERAALAPPPVESDEEPAPESEGDSPARPNHVLEADGDAETVAAREKAAWEQKRDELDRRVKETEAAVMALERQESALIKFVTRTSEQVALLDQHIEDGGARRNLLESGLQKRREQIEEHRTAYLASLSDYEGERATRDGLAARRRRWLALAIPGFIIVGMALAGYALWKLYDAKSMVEAAVSPEAAAAVGEWASPWAWRAFWGVSALYFGLGGSALGLYFLRNVHAPYTAAVRAVARLRGELDALRRRIVGEVNEVSRVRFEHLIHGTLVEWRSDLARFLKSLHGSLLALREAFDALSQEASGRYAAFASLPDRPFVMYAQPSGGLQGLLSDREPQVDQAIADMWRLHTLSKFFDEHRTKHALDSFKATLRGQAHSVFEDLRKMDLAEFLKFSLPHEGGLVTWLHRAYAKAAPFAARSDGGDEAETIFYAGVNPPDGPLAELLEPLHPRALYAPRETEGALLRMSLGFTAYQFDPVKTCRRHFDALSSGSRIQLFVSNEWADEAPDVEPSERRLGGQGDPVRQMATLALAYGLAQWDVTSNGRMEVVRYGSNLYETFGNWVNELRSLNGSAVRRSLQDEIQGKRNDRTAPHMETLKSYMETYFSRLDPVDLNIIEDEMEIYRPI